MKVTRILHAKRSNKGKMTALREQARRLGQVRSEVWQRFGSLQGVDVSDRKIRDRWLEERRPFPVSANAWKETLRDAKGDITANMASAKVNARRCIWRHTQDKTEQKRLFTALKGRDWVRDPYLRQVMRRHWVRGHNHTHNPHHLSVSSRGDEAGQGAPEFSEPQKFSQSPLKPGETGAGELAKDPVVGIGLFSRLLFQRRR